MTNNRAAVVTAFVAGAVLVAVAVVAYGGSAPTVEKSLAEKKAMLKAALRNRAMQQLDAIEFGAQDFGNTGAESGNKADEWNIGANFGGTNTKALAHGSTSGAYTVVSTESLSGSSLRCSTRIQAYTRSLVLI